MDSNGARQSISTASSANTTNLSASAASPEVSRSLREAGLSINLDFPQGFEDWHKDPLKDAPDDEVEAAALAFLELDKPFVIFDSSSCPKPESKKIRVTAEEEGALIQRTLDMLKHRLDTWDQKSWMHETTKASAENSRCWADEAFNPKVYLNQIECRSSNDVGQPDPDDFDAYMRQQILNSTNNHLLSDLEPQGDFLSRAQDARLTSSLTIRTSRLGLREI